MGHLPPETIKKLTHDNAAKLYGLDTEGPAPRSPPSDIGRLLKSALAWGARVRGRPLMEWRGVGQGSGQGDGISSAMVGGADSGDGGGDGGRALAAPAPDIRIDDVAVYPESLSAAPDGTVYVGSMKGVVFRAPRRARPRRALDPADAENGILSLLGVLADATSHTLWLCSSP